MVDLDRYKRQIAFSGIGEDGQRKLLASRVCIIGVGATGSAIANSLCRSGIGFIRIVDRDFVDLSNLQRQALYTEQDVIDTLPKVTAAYNHLHAINSEITIEPIAADVNSSNIESFIKDVDLVLDGTDNFETRGLLNEAADKLGIKWVYGGALGSSGATMNILHEGGPCFRCIMGEMPEAGTFPTCTTAGVVNPITEIVAALESAEALKILTGSDAVSKKYLALDIWENAIDYIEVAKDPECPVCVKKEYQLLGRPAGSYTTSLCGAGAWQVIPEHTTSVSFEAIAERLEGLGELKVNKFLLSFAGTKISFKLFPDGRAIIEGAADANQAKSIYAEYIGN
jgi:adenylyltransferase/sulfurtransferase